LSRSWLVVLPTLVLLLLLAVACDAVGAPGSPPAAPTAAPAGTQPTPQTGAPAKPGAGSLVKIGSKNFTEQLILGEMYAQLLEANGYRVERVLNLGGTIVAHEALRRGEIDLYPEYTGTGLLAILKKPVESDPRRVYETVSAEYKQQFNLVWLDQAPMNNSQALAVKRPLSQQRSLTTISRMAELASELTLAAVPDFPEREDGLVGLKRVYGDFQFKEVKIFDPGIKYRAFLDGGADVVLAFGTDGQINAHDLVLLEDDKGLWPPYHVAPVVRQQTLDANSDLSGLLNGLSPLLTDGVMQNLNWQVDGPDKKDPADVAGAFLREKGLAR
jgi:osmoprotectant transport system substrate-binding protein